MDEQRWPEAETRIFMAVFPNTTNHYDTLFGGAALKLMDEAAFICATRLCRKKVVTVSSDRVDFKHPIPSGTLAEFVANVVGVGRTSIRVLVEINVDEGDVDAQRFYVRHGFSADEPDTGERAFYFFREMVGRPD